MAHYRKLFKSDYIAAHDLEGKGDVHVTISELRLDEVPIPNKKTDEKEEKPALYFKGGSKGLILNRTNGDTIAALHGTDSDDWIGKRITLYIQSGVKAFGKTWDVVRVRNQIPPDHNGSAQDRTEVIQDEADLLTHGADRAVESEPEAVPAEMDALYGPPEALEESQGALPLEAGFDEQIALITDLEHTLGLKGAPRTRERQRWMGQDRLDLAEREKLADYRTFLESNAATPTL